MQTEITKFIGMLELFLDSMQLPHYTRFPDIQQLIDKEYINHIVDCCAEFVEAYIRCNMTHMQKHKMITEYGMKKLIDLQISYEGNSVCEELLNLDEYIDTWVQALLMNVILLN
jgi:hypothetical protein